VNISCKKTYLFFFVIAPEREIALRLCDRIPKTVDVCRQKGDFPSFFVRLFGTENSQTFSVLWILPKIIYNGWETTGKVG
jgi:hypothetical protein